LRETKSLSFGESKTLEKAKRLLVCEISEVIGKSLEEAEEQVDTAFKARIERAKARPSTGSSTRRPAGRNGDRREVGVQPNRRGRRARP
ncbi:MAG: hypothetical protein ACREAC_31000, partial [Blastocatellia bacterium]